MVHNTSVSKPYVFLFFFNRGETEGTNFSKNVCLIFVYVFVVVVVDNLCFDDLLAE